MIQKTQQSAITTAAKTYAALCSVDFAFSFSKIRIIMARAPVAAETTFMIKYIKQFMFGLG